MAYRACSSRNLPCGHGLAVGILAVLDGNAHRGKLLADTIGFLQILSRARRCALRDQAIDLLRIDAASLLLASLPRRGTHRKEAEQPKRGRELAAFTRPPGCRRVPQAVQDSHRLRRVEVVIERFDHRWRRLAA